MVLKSLVQFRLLLLSSSLFLLSSSSSSTSPPDCPDTPCAIRCRFGLEHDINGCQICQCLPDPCAVTLCPRGTVCEAVQNSDCLGGIFCDPFKAVCKPIDQCPIFMCTLECPSGFARDGQGCTKCKCEATCEYLNCEPEEFCSADASAPGGVRCASPRDLCCPRPMPEILKSRPPGTCFRDCSTMRCGGLTRCCPDRRGCYGCREAEPCRPLGR